jgi:hypothetical protein
MSELRLDKSKITHIIIKDKNPKIGLMGHIYLYRPEKVVKNRFWFDTSYPEAYYLNGIYCLDAGMCTNAYYTPDEAMAKDFLIEDNQLFYKPLAMFFIGNHKVDELNFSTLEEAKTYCDINFPQINYVL